MEQKKNVKQPPTPPCKTLTEDVTYIRPDEQPSVNYASVGRIMSMDVIRDIYEMAKLDVEKTEQAFDRITSKASVLMGLMVTVMLALISAFAACMVRNPDDLTTLICAAAALTATGICVFMLVYGVLSDKSMYTTGETADVYMNKEDIGWYENQPKENRDNAFFALKAGALKYRSVGNIELLTQMAKWYRRSIRLFVCSIAVIGVIYMFSQIFLEVF